MAIITELFFNEHHDVWSLFVFGGGWFVTCIMLYYIILYFVREYGLNHLNYVLVAAFLISILSFFLFYDFKEGYSMYQRTYYKWIFNFIFMLLGAIVGRKRHTIKASGVKDIMMLVLSIVVWYAIIIAVKKCQFVMDVQYVSLFPLAGVCYYFYRVCSYDLWKDIYNSRIWGQVLYITGGVCLEAYLIQWYLFTDKLNYMFPLNIPIIMFTVIFAAYIVKVLSNFYMQTFLERDYVWRNILFYKKYLREEE